MSLTSAVRRVDAAWWLGAAAVVLALNDHVLKHSALAGTVTGKLSDFAGLVAAPVVLAWALRACNVTVERSAVIATLVVGAAYTVLQLSSSCASVFDSLYGTVASKLYLTTARSVADAEDLIALPVLGLAYLLARSLNARRDWATRCAVSLAAVSCMGTSAWAYEYVPHWSFAGEDGEYSVRTFHGGTLVARIGKVSDDGSFEVGFTVHAAEAEVTLTPGEAIAELAGERVIASNACQNATSIRVTSGHAASTRTCFVLHLKPLPYARAESADAREGALRIPVYVNGVLEIVRFHMQFRSRYYVRFERERV